MRISLLLACFTTFTLVGCSGARSSDDAAPRSVRQGDVETVILSEGERTTYEARGIEYVVVFDRRISDGRCPREANCVQLGEALVKVRIVSDARTSEHVMRLPGLVFADSREGSHAWIETRGIRLTPLALDPYPGGAGLDQRPTLTLRIEPSSVG
jgi:hypothetical protein